MYLFSIYGFSTHCVGLIFAKASHAGGNKVAKKGLHHVVLLIDCSYKTLISAALNISSCPVMVRRLCFPVSSEDVTQNELALERGLRVIHCVVGKQ